ncbi:MAG: ribosome silencing factor [Verrucomicrobia bacterium]|nr:ribosome silencing factor [Verrucomicrobiota bacterium]
MDSRKLARLCGNLAENRKAEDIVILDVHNLTSITDYFVIVSGTSDPHLKAIVEEICDKLRIEHALKPHIIDGTGKTSSWVVIDYTDVIVHVMRSDVRARFDLDGLWGDAKQLRGKRHHTGNAA